MGSSPPSSPARSVPPAAPLRPSRHVCISDRRQVNYAFSVGSLCAVRPTRCNESVYVKVMGRDQDHVYLRWMGSCDAGNTNIAMQDAENKQYRARILVDAQGVEFTYVMCMRVKATVEK